ncbi:MAG: RnfABCDGE type electron transport complex subunit D [Clostridiales bacterium]|uniref:RnfABCDGE type electron transport complex subunit D n=1 Tax=Oscillospiraceae TaxID=216572 RepID=UPI0009A6D1E3|nr:MULTISPECIES: RnfABCDGE type electron transport complex subunit D [Oscillospiraceae]PWM39242.1 MAG: RnfABCDGE type electron transport complex subunit D [Clostridiales bacterium]RGB69823.1 RnfABCDGE type electron transport complex subunit D [Harryflintia acetispora]
MAEKLIVKSSPHIKSPVNTQRIMLDVIIAMVPALLCSVFIFGFRALLLTVVCVFSCVVFEYASRALMKRENTISDLSAVVTGMLLAFNLPVTFPFWIAVIGSFFAIVIVKQLFGGIGQNFVNPAIAARVFLLISFATPMTDWVIPKLTNDGIALVSGATPLPLLAQGKMLMMPPYHYMLFGLRGGCLGETAILALLLGGLYLIVRGVITPTIPVVYLGTVAVLSLLFGVDPIFHLLSGGVVLGAFFMATDYTTSPATERGKVIFAFGCGLITMLIRVFGSYPEGASFSILFMNILVPHINNLTRLTPFAAVKAQKKNKAKEGQA